jgi:hypothetical protein
MISIAIQKDVKTMEYRSCTLGRKERKIERNNEVNYNSELSTQNWDTAKCLGSKRGAKKKERNNYAHCNSQLRALN